MIWIWIAAAVALSLFFCRGKKVSIYHYIWILFPIEMYGVAIAGATIKPYMFAGLLIFFDNLRRRKSIIIPKSMILISVMILVTDCLNGISKESVMQHLMVIMVMFIAINYYIAINKEVALDEIAHVWISTLLGFGIVFIAVSLVKDLVGFNYGVLTYDRTSGGIFLWQQNQQTYSIRLRGFTMDPNAVIIALIPGATMSLYNILHARRSYVRSILAIAMYAYVVVLSGSRMALLCSFIMGLLVVAGELRSGAHTRWLLYIMIAVAMGLVVFLVLEIDIWEIIMQTYQSSYGTRSSLTDKYGRFSIWIENIQALISNNGLLFGVGQNQIQHYTELGRACHNTWLEWICGTGVFVGLGIVAWFLWIPMEFASKIRKKSLNKLSILVIVYWTIWVCITSVDNISNVTLLFMAYMFMMTEHVRGKNLFA